MKTAKEHTAELAKVSSGPISKQTTPVAIGTLERELLKRFPKTQAEPWDVMGLTVGNPGATVTGVYVALDPTVQAIEAAAGAGANVLLTHHPVFLEAPQAFKPFEYGSSLGGACVYEAARLGVALINIHTALDSSAEAQPILPTLLRLDYEQVLDPLPNNPSIGYGQLCIIREEDRPMTLEQLAARCLSVFGEPPRVWACAASPLQKVALMGGSARTAIEPAIKAGANVLICGELKYHDALEAKERGLSVIELGHDLSEFPLTALLATAAINAGVEPSAIAILDQCPHWVTPEATRL